MPHEIIFDKNNGRILLARRISAPRDDLRPGEGQGKLFVDFDFQDLPVWAFRVNPENNALEARDDYTPVEGDARLALSCDAASRSPIDGIPAIPADGVSITTLTVEKRSISDDRLLTGAERGSRLHIRTTAGTLSTNQATLKKGKASFTLRSSLETVVAEVRVWADEIPQPATILIEFTPPAA